MTGNLDRAIWLDLVARAIRNAALATPGLERAFVPGLLGWLHVELLLHFRESEALNRGRSRRTAVFACRSPTHGQWKANKWKGAPTPQQVPRRRPQTGRETNPRS